MSRRSTPERLYQAGGSGTVRRLTLEGELADRAGALVAAWEAHSAADGLERDGQWWDAAWEWVAAERAIGRNRRPPAPH